MRRLVVDLWDLVSIGLPAVVIVGVPVAVVVAVVGPAWMVAALVPIVVVAAVLSWLPRRRMSAPPAPDGVRVLAGNLWYWNPDMAAAARSLLADDPDVVVVSELSAEAHEVLAAHFAHHEVLRVGGATGHGVYSRFGLERLTTPSGPDLLGQVLWVRVDAPSPFVLCGAHMPRPVIFERPSAGCDKVAACRAEIGRLAALAASGMSTLSIVVAGDLNLADRQPAYRRLMAGRLDAMRTVRAESTFHAHPKHAYWRLFAMRIDHLIVAADWRVSDAKVVTISGSDHRAVAATIAPPTR